MILPRIFVFLATATLVVYILVVGKSILIPFVISLFIWYLINALADLYYSLYPLRTSIRYAAAIFTLGLVLYVPIELTSSTVPQVIDAAPGYQANFLKLIEKGTSFFGAKEIPSLASILKEYNLQTLVTNLASALANFTGNLLLILIYVAFLLMEQATFQKKITALFGQGESHERVSKMIKSIYSKIRSYVWVKSVGSILTGFLSYIILKAVGLDFAEFWAVVILFLNFIPNIGAIVGVAFPAILAMVQFDTLTPFLVVSIGAGAVQFFIGNILEPRLMGDSLNLSPFAILLSLFIWGAIWGIVGGLLAVPLMVVLMIVLAEFEDTRPVAILLSANGEIE
jgi:AI-2 transport protein TqsA